MGQDEGRVGTGGCEESLRKETKREVRSLRRRESELKRERILTVNECWSSRFRGRSTAKEGESEKGIMGEDVVVDL